MSRGPCYTNTTNIAKKTYDVSNIKTVICVNIYFFLFTQFIGPDRSINMNTVNCSKHRRLKSYLNRFKICLFYLAFKQFCPPGMGTLHHQLFHCQADLNWCIFKILFVLCVAYHWRIIRRPRHFIYNNNSSLLLLKHDYKVMNIISTYSILFDDSYVLSG